MTEIAIVGEGGIEEIEVFSAEFSLIIDGQKLEPAYTETIEAENNGEVTTLTDECGRQEQRRRNEGLWTVEVQGIVVKDGGPGSLDLRDVMRLQEGDEVFVISDFEFSGAIEVSNVIVGQSTDIVHIDIGNGPQLAFTFQLTLGERDSDR